MGLMSRLRQLGPTSWVVLAVALAIAVVATVGFAVMGDDEPATAPDEARRTPLTLPTPSPVEPSTPETPDEPERTRPLRLGISPGISILDAPDDEMRADLASAVRLGVDRVRLDLSWARVERTPGVLDWADSDRVVDASRDAGLKVLVVVSYTPSWAALADGSPDPELFGEFVSAAAERYGDRVYAWEMWNGPNRQSFWGARPDPREYARVAAAGARAVRADDPRATVVVGSLAPAENGAAGRQTSPEAFLRGFYAAGIKRSLFDVVSIHPYTYPALPRGRQPWNTFARLPELHQVMQRAGDGDKPVWLTEYGASTGESARSVGERRQAEMMVGAVRGARDLPYVDSLWFYSLRDTVSDSRDPAEGFGLIDDQGRPKPAYSALQRELRRN